MRRVGIIQAHSKGFHGGESLALKKINGDTVIEQVIDKLKQIEILDDIIIAVPDVKENRTFKNIAAKHNVKYFAGEKDNVARRLLSCAEENEAEVILLVIGNDLAINPRFLEDMVKMVEDRSCEAVLMSQDPFSGGGCVITKETLKKVTSLIMEPGVDESYVIRPVAFIRANRHKFRLKIVEAVLPGKEEVEQAQAILRRVLVAGGATDVDLKRADRRDFSIFKYEFATRYVVRSDIVLDAACAQGGGSYILSRFCKEVVGIDVSQDAIELAKRRYGKKNLKFYVGDATELHFLEDESFDKVTSFDTVEHVEDDRRFIREICRVLKPNGLLILSAPRRVGEMVINPYHIREYSKSELQSLIEEGGFDVREFHFQSLYVVTDEDMGEGFLWVCQKR